MKKFVFLVLTFLSPVVLAQGNSDCPGGSCGNDPDCPGGSCDQPDNGQDWISVDVDTGGSESYSNSEAYSDASSSSTSTSTSSSESSSNNSVTITENNPKSLKVRNVASPDTPNPYPTAPCRVGVSGGLSLAGGAFSGGGSVEDEECTLRETARSFKDLGVPEMGLYLLCTQSDVVLGRRDKKGELQKNQEPPLGASECLRLVREFQGEIDEPVATRSEVQILQEQLELLQHEISQHETEQRELELAVSDVRQISERTESRITSARPQPQVQVQEYLNQAKRDKLAALITEEIVITLDDEETEE